MSELKEYVIAYEPSVNGLTIRVNTDVSPVRFRPVSSYDTFEEANEAMAEIRKVGLTEWEKAHID